MEGKLLEAQRHGAARRLRPRDDRRDRIVRRHRELQRASSPAACPASRRRRCSSICPRTLCCSSTRATRPCRRSAAWRAAIIAARSRSPSTDFACRRASTTGRCASTNGTRCARRPSRVSATPGPWEIEQAGGVFAEQVIRPTGLVDPPVEIRPVEASGRRPGVQECEGYGRRRAIAHAGHDADQADGRGPHRISPRGGPEGPLHALRRRDAGAHRADPRSAARRVRRAGRHQFAARGARHPRMRTGRDPRRRQGRLPALRDLADPDDRARRAQRRGQA